MSNSSHRKYTAPEPRYKLIKYDDDVSTPTVVIQDTTNDNAWIETTHAVDITP